MRLNDVIVESILQYPLLYRDVSYEKSKIKVLDHLFLTVGNGYSWSHGVLAGHSEPSSGELYPEGAAAFEEGYFTKPLLITEEIVPGLSVTYDQCNTYPWVPYPISAKYSRIMQIPDDVQEDWLAGAVEILRQLEEFYGRPIDNIVTIFDMCCTGAPPPPDFVEEQRELLKQIRKRLNELTERD